MSATVVAPASLIWSRGSVLRPGRLTLAGASSAVSGTGVDWVAALSAVAPWAGSPIWWTGWSDPPRPVNTATLSTDAGRTRAEIRPIPNRVTLIALLAPSVLAPLALIAGCHMSRYLHQSPPVEYRTRGNSAEVGM